MAQLLISDNSTPASQTWALPAMSLYWEGSNTGTSIIYMGEKITKIQGGSGPIAKFLDSTGAVEIPSSGYYNLNLWI